MATEEELGRLRVARSCFDGLLLSAVSYGALLMIFIQTTQVLLIRPSRDRIFWGIVYYTALMFILSTIGIAGRFKVAEMTYIQGKINPESKDPLTSYFIATNQWEHVLNQASVTLLPWVADLLMFYRLFVLWNHRWSILVAPLILYLGKNAMSIPLLVALSKLDSLVWRNRYRPYLLAYSSLTAAFNVAVTVLVLVRLYMLRSRAEQVMGKLQSIYYNSLWTRLVESGAFFTCWAICSLVLTASRHWAYDILLQPSVYLNAIIRMLITLRMAQDKAWSNDAVVATSTGVLEWQVSSSHSVPLPEDRSGDNISQDSELKNLPKKFREF